ncbi:Cyk3p [Nakaseomyces bracarensis]|uniref:Cyk3p n=1 Tax=Nakaseomyces bracarensis TaxID=273131 RepID=UPI00387145BF
MATSMRPFKVKAKYGWAGQAEEDLGFLEGDVMEVTRVAGDWYYGRLLRNKKCAGYFPNNFVSVVEERINSSQSLDKQRERSREQSIREQSQGSKVSLPPIPGRGVISIAEGAKHRSAMGDDSRYRSRQAYHSTPELAAAADDRAYRIGYNEQLSMRKRMLHNDSLTKKPRAGGPVDAMPSLPPLPGSNGMSHMKSHHKQPIKSYSSNDISLGNRDSAAYYKENQNFYDGYSPSKRSSVDTISESSGGIFSNSQYLDNSLTSSENSFAIMSDFSATSAGSFARHRKAQSFTDSMERSENGHSTFSNYSGDKRPQLESKSSGGFWNRLMNKGEKPQQNSGGNSPKTNGDMPKLPDLQNLNISSSQNETHDWITVQTHVNRSRSLTKYEKHPRYMRALEENRDLVLHPQDAIYNGLNTNEVRGNGRPGAVDIELAGLNTEYIDSMTWKRCKTNNPMRIENWARTTFSARYGTEIEKLRGVYIFCTEMFSLIDDHGQSDFSREPKNLDKILNQKYCTPYELTCLFKKLATSLGIKCEIVIGFLKTPFSNTHEFEYNHCWLRVLVSNEWRFIDVILGNVTNPIHEFVNGKPAKRTDDSYFLVEPLEFIYTHVPPKEYEQHIVPSLDQLSVLYLPLVFPSFFRNGLMLYKFSTALASLEDNEIYECSLEVPNDIEIFSSVVVSTADPKKSKIYKNMELSLVQVKKHRTESGKRVVVVKAVLPPGTSEGALYIHSGIRGTQTTIANVHPLSMIIPLTHKGKQTKYEFVTRIPNENVQKVETYIMEPQNKYLLSGNEYTFEILQNPFDGIMYNTTSTNHNVKQPIAVKSPSGKIHHLEKSDPNFPFGTWRKNVKIKESGIWCGLVMADSGLGWTVFAEWVCI